MSSRLSSIRTFFVARSATLSVSLKLSSAFAAVLLLGVLGMGIYSNQRARQQAIQGELATLSLLAERLAGQVDMYLSTTRSLARHLALTQDVERFLATRPKGRQAMAFNAWLGLQAERMPGHSDIIVLAPDGTCLASSNPAFIGNNFGFRPYFQEALAGKPYNSDWAIGAVTQTPRLFSAAPVFSGKHISGVLVTQYEVEELERTVRTFGQSGRMALLVNRLGIVLTHSNPAFIYHAIETIPHLVLEDLSSTRQFLGRSFPLDPLSPEFPAAFHQTLLEGKPRTARYQIAGQMKWGALSPVQGQPWVVAVSVPESDILGPTRVVWKDTITMGILSAGGAFLLALGLVRLLLRPLRALSAAIAAFGQGDTTSRAPIQTHRELDDLAHTFNTMADTIQSHHENLEELVQQRTRDLEQALADMKSLEGMIPICSYCKQIRDDSGSWWQLESYIQTHSEAQFSHGICPDCRDRHFPRRPSN